MKSLRKNVFVAAAIRAVAVPAFARKMMFALATIGLAAGLSSCTTADGKEWAFQDQPAADGMPDDESEAVREAVGALSGTSKVCSGVVSGNYRDSIIVPNGWNTGRCQQWAASIGASYQLGCVFETGYSWGAFPGGIPANNCGW